MMKRRIFDSKDWEFRSQKNDELIYFHELVYYQQILT